MRFALNGCRLVVDALKERLEGMMQPYGSCFVDEDSGTTGTSIDTENMANFAE